MEPTIDLIKLRTSLKWSQEEMADALGVSQPTISRMENQKVALRGPTLKLLKSIALQSGVEA